MTTDTAQAARGLFVVETHDGQAYLGTLEKTAEAITVYSGFVGRPPIVRADDVAAVIAAENHPDVEIVAVGA